MEQIYIAPIVLILFVFAFLNHLRAKEWDIHRVYIRGNRNPIITSIIAVVACIYLTTCIFDFIAVTAHKIDVYELPSVVGTISAIHTNEKPGADSKITLNNEEYRVDVKLLRERNVLNDELFYTNKNYRIYITPIYKVVYNIVDLENVNMDF